ncbi:globin family protein [Promicromonospora sp. NPDC057138]|uniref:globin family protein n=1 Tax=Promicromonospora sp. NPDC057138 TaxID=3346031 RepID=UPI0036422472
MEQHHIDHVQRTFAQVAPIADVAATLFYDDLFERDPSLRSMFPEDLTEQRKKLMMVLGVAVNGLSNWSGTSAAVRELGSRHAGYGVTEDHFPTVGAALLATLEKGLGDDFTPEVREAWTECYGLVSGEMRAGLLSAAA